MSRGTDSFNSYFPISHLQQYPTKYPCFNKIQLIKKKMFFQNISSKHTLSSDWLSLSLVSLKT